MNRKTTIEKWICLLALCIGPVVCISLGESCVQGVMAQQREVAANASGIQEPTGSGSLAPDVNIEEPEPGVKLFGDPVTINLSYPAFGWEISNDGSILVAGERAPSLVFWSLIENRVVRTLEKPEGNSIWFPSRYSASGKVLAATYQTWRTPDAEDENTETDSSTPFPATTTGLFVNQDGQVRSEVEIDETIYTPSQRTVAFSPNEKYFLFGGPKNATVVEVDSGEIIAQLANFRDPVFIGNQSLLSVVSNEIWNFATNEILSSPTQVFPKNSALRFTSSNGQWALVDVRGQGAMLVHLPDGKRLPLSGINGYMMGSFSSDGRYLAVSGSTPGGRGWIFYDTQAEAVLGKVDADSALISMFAPSPRRACS
jgi:WD40 repeat protein